jgi:hypothetical protein
MDASITSSEPREFKAGTVQFSPPKNVQKRSELSLSQAAGGKPVRSVFQFAGHFCASLFGLHVRGNAKKLPENRRQRHFCAHFFAEQ